MTLLHFPTRGQLLLVSVYAGVQTEAPEKDSYPLAKVPGAREVSNGKRPSIDNKPKAFICGWPISQHAFLELSHFTPC